jgi:hypothetical protein
MDSLQAKAFLANLTSETSDEILKLLLKPKTLYITIIYDSGRSEWYDYYPGISDIYFTKEEQIDALMLEVDSIHKVCYEECKEGEYMGCNCGELPSDDESGEEYDEKSKYWTRQQVIKHFQHDGHYGILCTVFRRDITTMPKN